MVLTKERLEQVFGYTDGLIDRKDVGICLDSITQKELVALLGFIDYAKENEPDDRGLIVSTLGHDIGLFIGKYRDGVDDGSSPRSWDYGKYLEETREERATRWLETPPAEWADLFDGTKNVDIAAEVSLDLGSRAQRSVMLIEYLTHRYGGGLHTDAVKEANKRLVRVRRAMGYSEPSAGKFTF